MNTKHPTFDTMVGDEQPRVPEPVFVLRDNMIVLIREHERLTQEYLEFAHPRVCSPKQFETSREIHKVRDRISVRAEELLASAISMQPAPFAFVDAYGDTIERKEIRAFLLWKALRT